MIKDTQTFSTVFSLNHIEKMTDNIGILEHCIFSTPDRREGYALDDNARALQVFLRLGKDVAPKIIKKYTSIYLQFLILASAPKGFHQDLNADLSWKDVIEINDGFGRAMAALGDTAVLAQQSDQKLTAAFLFDQQFPHILHAHPNRTKAQIITGIQQRMRFESQSPELIPLLVMRKKLKGEALVEVTTKLQFELLRLADEILSSYQQTSTDSWNWFEDVLSYDNGRLPLSMFMAYQVSKDEKYLEVAVESLDFLISQTYDVTHDCFSFAGYRGWLQKGAQKALFGQQPIEAGSTVEVCCVAYQVTHQKKYLDFAKKALEWYSGRNILNISLLNTETGGVQDGLEEWGVNPNEGAESILSYTLASLAIEKVSA